MGVQKYDYQALKLEFFKSDFDELKAFLSEKWVNYTSWGIAKMTRWWTKEKQEWKEKILQKALEENAKKQAKSLQVPLEELMKWKKAILQLLLVQVSKYVKLSQKWEDFDIDTNDVDRILKIFKTELWEPTKITKNENTNFNNEELTEEDQQILNKIFNKWNE